MTGVLRAELRRSLKRPATQVLAAVLVGAVLLFGYLLNYTVIGAGLEHVDDAEILRGLLPTLVVPTTLGQLAQFGAPIALILGALTFGSDYHWRTVKVIATQGPGRTTLQIGRFAALATVTGLLAAATLVAALLASSLVAVAQVATVAWPTVGELAGGLSIAWLALVVFAAFGACLAELFRGSALAIGIGLLYFFVIEIAMPLPSDVLDVIGPAMLGPNTIALVTTYGLSPVAPFAVFGQVPSPTQAISVLGLYTAVFALVSLVSFVRRPIA